MKQLGATRVEDYLTKQVVVVDDTAQVTYAIRLMAAEEVTVLPVVDQQGELVGILSNRDLLSLTHEIHEDLSALHLVNMKTRDTLIQILVDRGDNTRVCDVMTTPVETVAPEMNMIVAAKKLNNRSYHHLPVVNQEGSLVGILTTSDFVRAIAETGALAAG